MPLPYRELATKCLPIMRQTNVVTSWFVLMIDRDRRLAATHGQDSRRSASMSRAIPGSPKWAREADGNNGAAPRLKLKSIQEMSLVDIDPGPLVGPDDPVGNAAPEESRRRTARRSDGQQRRGRVVRGDRQRLRDPAGRRDIPPSPPPRPRLVDRRRRPLPRHAGQRRHALANGRRVAARSRGLAAHCRRSPGRGGSRGRPEPRLPGLRRHRLGVDAGPARRSPSGSFPTASSTAASRTGRALPISRSSRARRTAGRRRPRAACGSRPQTALLPAGEALVTWVTPRDDGPAGTLGFRRDGRWPSGAARADPAGRPSRASGSRCTCAT